MEYSPFNPGHPALRSKCPGPWHFGGVVWIDANRDGIRDTGETAVAGVTVQVRKCSNNALVATTATASDGTFTFSDSTVPRPGPYRVSFTHLPASYVFTKQIYPPPTNGTIVSTCDPLTGSAPCFSFDQLENMTLNNAGICKALTNVTITPLNPVVVCPGETATFSTVASGSGPFTYLWRQNGIALSGKTTNTLIIPAVTATNSGTYTVEVTGAANSVTNSATLTVNAPTTASALTSLVRCSGDSASFNTVASGTGPFGFVWRKDGVLLAGKTSNSLNIASVTSINAGVYSVEITGTCNTVTNTATLTVNAPTTASALTSLVRCSGDSASFSTVASGTGPFTYVWRKDGASLAGQTTNSLNIGSVTASDSGTYKVEVSGSCNSVTNTATLTVNTPTTATPLVNLVRCSGDSASFNTVASGTGPFGYVWRKDGVLLAGKTSNAVNIASVTAINAGVYSVEITGACNSVTNSATLTVNAPTTASALTSLVTCSGESASFSTVVSGTGPFTYVWRKDGALLTGQTTNSLNIGTVTSSNAGTYKVEVSGSCNSVTNTATLTVNTPTTATPLVNLVRCSGDSAVFSTEASGAGPFVYVWKKDGILLQGQTTNSLNLASVDQDSAGIYSVEITGTCNTVTNAAALTVNVPTGASALTSLATCSGESANFSTVASGTGPFTYVWRKDGTLLAGQTTNSLNLTNVAPGNAGFYSVEITGACNTATNSATLTVNAPTMASALTSLVTCSGESASFNTVVSGTGPFTYVWRKDGTLLAGQTTNSLSLTNVAPGNAGFYSIEVTGTCNTVTNTATLTVNTPTTTTSLSNLKLCPGENATFTTVPAGTGPFTYRWLKNGNLLSLDNTNSFAIPTVGATDSGLYAVEVTGACNSVTNTAFLTVNTPTSATPLTDLTRCIGEDATFNTAVTGTGPFVYVWRKDGVLLPDSTTNSLTIHSVKELSAGLYSVEVAGNCNTVTNFAMLQVNTPVTASALDNVVCCLGDSAVFRTVPSGTGPFNYVWRKDGILLVGQTNQNLLIESVTSTTAGTYSVEVAGACNVVTNTASLKVNTPTTATSLPSLTRCSGESASFSTLASGTGPFTYVWRKDGVLLTGQTTNSLNIDSVDQGNAGVYSVEITGICNTVTNAATLTVNSPTTASALTSLVTCSGDSASFSTEASGTGPFTYVWRKDGVLLIARTSSSLNIDSVSLADAGGYSVEVSGTCNTVTNSATLTVNSPTTASALTSLVTCSGDSASFSTVASGTGPFTYVWRKDGALLADQTTNSFNLASADQSSAGVYSVEVTGNCNTVTNTATLAVNIPTMASPLTSLVRCPGDSASFSTMTSGTGPFTYVWRKDGTILTGQTTNSLNIAASAPGNAGIYSVEITGACNAVTNTAMLIVNTPTAATPLVSSTRCPGDSASFSTIPSGTGPFTYVWRKEGAILAAQTTSSLNIASVTLASAGSYSVEVSGTCNTVTNSAALTVNAPTTASALTSLVTCSGENASFNTVASGTGPFTYVWRKDGAILAAQTLSSLNITTVTLADAGSYSVEVTGSCNTVTNVATLAVNVPTTSSALMNLTQCPGDTATFFTVSSGTGPFNYVWRKNDTLLTGHTSSSITIPAVTAADAGTYAVEVTGACGSVTNSAVLAVNSPTTATMLKDLVKNLGESATYSTVASGTGPFSYIWRKDGKTLAGQTSSSIIIPAIAPQDAGLYSVEVSGTCNSITNSARLTMNVPPTVTIISPTNGSVFIALANLTVLADANDVDGTITKVEFFVGQTNKIGETTSAPPYFTLWTNVPPGNYQLRARATDDSGATSLSDIVNITVVDQPPIAVTGPIKFNPQTGLFEQPARVTNPTYYTYDGVRVGVRNLAPGVQVYNASGMTNGIPFIQTITPMPPGASLDLVIEYYIPNRVPPSPLFSVELVAALNAHNQVGPSQHIDRGLRLPDKTFLVEFNTRSNRLYYVQYGTNLIDWKTAFPPIKGTGSRIQWIDNGQPKTEAAPSTQPSRFYRIILLP